MERHTGSEQQVTALIEQLIAEYLAKPEGPVPRAIVRLANALPVYSDMGGTLFVTPSREVLFSPLDSTDPPTVESNPGWRSVAFVRASDLHPGLASLRPPRPAEGVDCDACDGSGLRMWGQTHAICALCMGTGWRTPEI